MFHGACAAGGNQRNVADRTHFFQLLEVVTVAYAVLVHHVQHDFTRTAFLYFLHPVQRLPLGDARAAFIAGVLVNVIFARRGIKPGVDPHDNALHAKAIRQTRNQLWIGERRGVNGNFVRTERENLRRIVSRFNPARHAEGNINHLCHARHPAFVHHAAIAGGGDIVKYQFVCAFFGIAFCQRNDVTNDLVVAELHAFYNLTITHVQAGNYPFCQH